MESSVARISFKLHLREEDQLHRTRVFDDPNESLLRVIESGVVPGRKHALLSATVEDGTVKSWGIVDSEAEKEATRVAAEQVAGVRAIENNVIVQPAVGGA